MAPVDDLDPQNFTLTTRREGTISLNRTNPG